MGNYSSKWIVEGCVIESTRPLEMYEMVAIKKQYLDDGPCEGSFAGVNWKARKPREDAFNG